MTSESRPRVRLSRRLFANGDRRMTPTPMRWRMPKRTNSSGAKK